MFVAALLGAGVLGTRGGVTGGAPAIGVRDAGTTPDGPPRRSTSALTFEDAWARPTPSEPVALSVIRPTTAPHSLSKGPPLLPSFTAASVWISGTPLLDVTTRET